MREKARDGSDAPRLSRRAVAPYVTAAASQPRVSPLEVPPIER